MGSHLQTRPSATRRSRTVPVLVIAALVLLAVRLWVVEPLLVSSSSMEPTVAEGSVVLLYRHGEVTQGSLVSFANPTESGTMLKRVVATGGQSVAIKDALLYVDGVEVREPFVDHSRIDGTYFGPVTVPAGHVFVLGDNRDTSIDSREYGALPLESIEATVIWPLP
ncbi:signal peptidase I [Arthrobacter pigmenti]|uniref:Signal peptidase I n=1 Tax=Arthrobacter pigmenti TaxID=271432 RepID=A0A846RHX2_9MICC|nr:signal peptidase I [Arthrobacter pigmenti]NJC22743.1 signal peptidase I [Arthrobacter pigmenti]